MASVIPKESKKDIIDGWLAETWWVCLLDPTFVYASGTHVNYADLLASGKELPTAGNYTATGQVLTRLAWGVGATGYNGTAARIDATDSQWVTATFTAGFAAVYNTATGRIRGIYDLGSNSVTGGTFTIQWNDGGLIQIA